MVHSGETTVGGKEHINNYISLTVIQYMQLKKNNKRSYITDLNFSNITKGKKLKLEINKL